MFVGSTIAYIYYVLFSVSSSRLVLTRSRRSRRQCFLSFASWGGTQMPRLTLQILKKSVHSSPTWSRKGSQVSLTASVLSIVFHSTRVAAWMSMRLYSGYHCDTMCNNVFLFDPNGIVSASALNYYGSDVARTFFLLLRMPSIIELLIISYFVL